MSQGKIAVIFHSQSAGNTRAAAELVAKGIREAGEFEVILKNTNEGRLDPAVLEGCAGVAVGTPDYFSYPAGGLKMFIDDWLIAKNGGNEKIEGMPVALFVTHGGGGRAKEPHETLFRHIGPQVGETVLMQGKPNGEAADACVALGKELAAAAEEYLSEGA